VHETKLPKDIVAGLHQVNRLFGSTVVGHPRMNARAAWRKIC
jgi:hypothetical protein